MTERMNQMKLSDYVARFLAELGIKHAFIISGGASIHLLHSLHDRTDIDAICPHHEQAAAMSADGYARVTGRPGCAIGTSGPGATNLITGIAGAWFDSVPVIYISGQVATYRMKGTTGVRQMGFQETDILPMVAPITKYAVQITDTSQIAYELEKATHIAISGRPGPVLIDIPDDLQRQFVDPEALPHFVAEDQSRPSPAEQDIESVLALIRNAKRPVMVIGWGVRLAGAEALACQVVEQTGIPVLTSWAAKDIFPADHPQLVGTFGTHGTRAGNFAMQNADCVISVGARLSTHETGTPMSSWAREAKIAIVDIDPTELAKFPAFDKPIDVAVQADAREFLQHLSRKLPSETPTDIAPWKDLIASWLQRYPVERLAPATSTVDPYALMSRLSAYMPDDEQVFVDTGCSVAWMMQAFPVRGKQRLYHDFNNTAMGWALPAAIGGSLALDSAPVTCVSGDGSLMMNIQELATIQRHKLPVRLFLVNNEGYGMVQQTQEQWLGGQYVGTSLEGGLAFPDFVALAKAFEIPTLVVNTEAEVNGVLQQAYAMNGPVFVDIRIPRTERVTPQSRFGYPIEDADPLLPRDEFLAAMIVKPMPKSQEPLV